MRQWLSSSGSGVVKNDYRVDPIKVSNPKKCNAFQISGKLTTKHGLTHCRYEKGVNSNYIWLNMKTHLQLY